MFKSSDKKKMAANKSTANKAEPSPLAAQVLGLPAEQRADILKILQAATTSVAAQNVGPGRYYDAKSDKTYRQRRPVRRSKLYSEAEALQKRAVADIRDWCISHQFTYDKEGNSLKKSDGTVAVLDAELKKEFESLKKALENAKSQYKTVREAEAVHRTPKSASGTVRDPQKLPTIIKKDGKLSWADQEEETKNAPT
jgi:hypothetical protein